MTDNDPNQLREALELWAPDAPDEHWEAAVECQSSRVSTHATAGTPKTSTGLAHCTLLVLFAIGIILACTSIIINFNPLRTDDRKPLTSTCPALSEEGAAFWHIITKDFSTTSVLILKLSSDMTANGAIDRFDESRFYNAASNVEQASMVAVDGIHVYTSCLDDFANREQNFIDRDGKKATRLREKRWSLRSHSSISAALSDQIQTFSHKVSMTTDAGLKLQLLLDQMVMAIRALRALIYTARMQNSLGGKTNGGGAGQTALLNVLDRLQRSVESCRYFLSRIEDRTRNASRLTRQTFEKAVEARFVSAGSSASKDEVVLRELHSLDVLREDARRMVRAWGLTVTGEDRFLFRWKEAERMWNAMQVGVGKLVSKD
ncbi:MAG: hypothetical protein Q9177_001920 [Variospora cf. flavescens]